MSQRLDPVLMLFDRDTIITQGFWCIIVMSYVCQTCPDPVKRERAWKPFKRELAVNHTNLNTARGVTAHQSPALELPSTGLTHGCKQGVAS